jgi:O-antigen/teichoic acid export membrane protein
MAQGVQAHPASAARTPSLTQGLARNSVFNLLGWIWPIALSIFSVPFVLGKLGNDAYGIFAIVSIVAGYLGLLSGPVAMGNVRFMAEAFARQEWWDLRKAALTGLLVSGLLSLLGGLAMFMASGWLARSVFTIPVPMVGSAITAFRLAALSFVLNGLIGATQSIPTAMRRYDLLNAVGLVAGTMNTLAIVVALWWGFGLLGAVAAQVFSSGFGLTLSAVVGLRLLRRLPFAGQRSPLTMGYVRELASFSSLLFAGQIASQIGLQIDRTVVGILLGTSAMTFYTVPTKITDRVPSLMSILSRTLYPLSSEAVATHRTGELRQLYHEMIRLLLWLSAFVAALLIVLSKDLLALWIGYEFMANSWLVLSLLAAGVVWRSSGSVAYQVCTGMGRADVNLVASIGTAVFMVVPVLILAPRGGAPGVAMGVFIGLLVANLAYDLFAQRKLLGVKSWGESLWPYARVGLAEAGTVAFFYFLPVHTSGWFGLVVKAGLVSCVYLVFSLVTRALAVRDIKFVTGRVGRLFSLVRDRRVLT